MNRQHSYLLAEGQQDVHFLARLLTELGLQSIRQPSDIPARWLPFADSLLLQRDRGLREAGRDGIPLWQMFKPACLFNDSHVVVVERVSGNRAQFGRTLRATNELIDGGLSALIGVGIIPDADSDPEAAKRSAQDAMHSAGLVVPMNDGNVVVGQPNTGVFVLPGNGAEGGLEELLLECAAAVYPKLAASAHSYIDSISVADQEYTEEDMKEMRTAQGPKKAAVGAISCVLKPGSTVQVSILRDRWICDATMTVQRVSALVVFLRNLCGLN